MAEVPKTLWQSYGLPGLQHAIGALLIQLACIYSGFGSAWHGAALGVAFFAGREHVTCCKAFGTWLGLVPKRLQGRTAWDLGTAALPVTLLAYFW